MTGRYKRCCYDDPLWSPLAHQQQTDSFQQFNRGIRAFGQEQIGAALAIVEFNFSGEENRWRLRRQVLDLFDQLLPVASWKNEVAQDQVDTSDLENLDRLFGRHTGNHPIPARFQHHFSNGEGLFVIVDAKDSTLRLHHIPRLANTGLLRGKPFQCRENDGHARSLVRFYFIF